ncbi:hypothetical protein PUN28_019172 [Cardiocondyla obscurior]|uniref:Uncharacterized protein n=1 Tax=Cardiocondyla obscurior TaxID=286306 RepID=A0AAW2EHJ4_9HYME
MPKHRSKKHRSHHRHRSPSRSPSPGRKSRDRSRQVSGPPISSSPPRDPEASSRLEEHESKVACVRILEQVQYLIAGLHKDFEVRLRALSPLSASAPSPEVLGQEVEPQKESQTVFNDRGVEPGLSTCRPTDFNPVAKSGYIRLCSSILNSFSDLQGEVPKCQRSFLMSFGMVVERENIRLRVDD